MRTGQFQWESDMVRKTVSFNRSGIGKLPTDKPALYRIQTEGGKTNYAGVAKRGRVQERIAEHLAGAKDPVPGAKVRIEQMRSIAEVKRTEARVITRSKAKYNDRARVFV